MKHFYAYEPSGRIVMTGTCPDDQLKLQVVPGAAVAEGRADQRTQYRSAAGQLVNLPTRPSPHHQFDYGAEVWVGDETSAWAAVRAERDRLIAATDWTQLPDVPLGTRDAWATYRQALRDITLQGDPFAIAWPVAPG